MAKIIIFVSLFIFSKALFCNIDGDGASRVSACESVSYIDRVNSSLSSFYDSTNIWWASQSVISDSLRKVNCPYYPEYVYNSRIADLDEKTPIKLEYNEHVLKYIEAYGVKNRPKLQSIISKSAYYFPIFEEYLDKYGLPLELKYLAAVESALDARAVSKSGAVGLWQFMKPTSDLLDVKVTSYIDERRDVYKSTDAACRYLKYLYETFGDWQLALAAFNGGPGTVKKAIAQSGGKTNYWDLRPYFTEQMRNYVPAFIAMNYLMEYHAEHNIFPNDVFIESVKTDTLYVNGYVHLKNIAELVGTDYELLKNLNPVYTYAYIPMDGDKHCLVLPFDVVHKYYQKEQEIVALKNNVKNDTVLTQPPFMQKPVRENIIYHNVERGDNLFRISQRYACTIPEIYQWNNLDDNYILRVGDSLKIMIE